LYAAAGEIWGAGFVAFHLAWRILTNEKLRTALAIAGIFIAILLVFVELGFFVAVPQGGMLIYDNMRFDLLLTSDKYVFQAQSWVFPRERLAEAARVSGVAGATPVYFGLAKWQSPNAGVRPDAFVIGIDPRGRPFAVEDIERQQATLERADTFLIDGSSRSLFGPLTAGRVVELDKHKMTLGGDYKLGTGFLGLGVILVDEANFFRIFPRMRPETVNLGLITVNPGVDPGEAAAALRRSLQSDVRVFTRDELASHETAYWTTRTSVGLIFGSGLIVSFIVGIMVLYQTLATQITRHLPEFATLKAIGYTDGFMTQVVLIESMLVVVVAFAPALLTALGLYSVFREQTLLPIGLNPTRLAAVLGITVVMAAISGFLSVSGLRRADPADVF